PFAHYIFDNGSEDGTRDWLRTQLFTWLELSPDNKGQCIASNRCLDAIGQDYDFIVRLDNDIIPKTQDFLQRMLEAQRALDKKAVISPDIVGLEHKPKPFGEHSVGGFNFEFVEILGGACRLAPAALFKDFRFTEHGPLALGEAQQI